MTNTSQANKLNEARKVDNVIGATLADICDYVTREDYPHALQAACYLVVFIAAKAGTKPFTALRAIYKAS